MASPLMPGVMSLDEIAGTALRNSSFQGCMQFQAGYLINTARCRSIWIMLLVRGTGHLREVPSDPWHQNETMLSAALDEMMPRFPAACSACCRCLLDHQACLFIITFAGHPKRG